MHRVEEVHADDPLGVPGPGGDVADGQRGGVRGEHRAGVELLLELVQELWALSKSHPNVTLQWIKAHDGSRWNEYADALASSYML